MLIDLLNRRITPVVQSRGTLGEGDLAQLANVGATMERAGDAYYQGNRMPAADALAKAGLKPIKPFAADTNALTSSDAYATGIAALVVHDAQKALGFFLVPPGGGGGVWGVKGPGVGIWDPKRIIQDPESLRASSIRQASAWEEWAALRDAVVLQMNSSDHNPAVRTDLSPQDSC